MSPTVKPFLPPSGVKNLLKTAANFHPNLKIIFERKYRSVPKRLLNFMDSLSVGYPRGLNTRNITRKRRGVSTPSFFFHRLTNSAAAAAAGWGDYITLRGLMLVGSLTLKATPIRFIRPYGFFLQRKRNE